MDKVSKLTGTVALGAAALAAMPGEATAVDFFETESNNTFPGLPDQGDFAMIVGDRLDANINNSNILVQDIDFFRIIGLSPGAIATFAIQTGNDATVDLEAGIYTDATTTTDSVVFGEPFTSLSGVVSSSGDIVVGVKDQVISEVFEDYRFNLQSVTSPENVPEPATVVLLAAGLAGLHVVRRRKRG